MGQQVIPQYTPEAGSPVGAIVSNFLGNAIIAAGASAPADGGSGYESGCIFIKNAGTEDAQIYINVGTSTSCNFDPITTSALDGLTASTSELNVLDGQTMSVPAGAGFTGGTGTVYANRLTKIGGIKKLEIMVDLTGLASSTTDLDIIGVGASAAHLGQILAAEVGTVLFGQMTCKEVPLTGADDVDLYYATEATGVFDSLVTDLTETALITSGGAWTLNQTKQFGADLPADKYLYLTGGEAGTAGTYTAGKFFIEIWGY